MAIEFVPVSGTNLATGKWVVHDNIDRIEVDGVLVGFHDHGHPIALIRPVSESERAAIDAMAVARTGEEVKIVGPPSQPQRIEEPDEETEDANDE